MPEGPALKGAPISTPEGIPSVVSQPRLKVQAEGPPQAGTTAATSSSEMNAPLQSTLFCRPDEQNLPGQERRSAEMDGLDLPGEGTPGGEVTRTGGDQEAEFRPAPGPLAFVPPPLPREVSASAGPAAPAAANLPSLHGLMLEQVMQVKLLRADALAVVLTPDQATELFVEVRQREGQTHVYARCDRGDVTLLETQWDSLRTLLAEHGMRLAPLNEAPPVPRPDSSLSRSPAGLAEDRRHWQRPPERPAADTLEDLPMVGSLTEPLRSRAARLTAVSRRAWEWWA